mmetsp:Transcript_2304/g.3937  ORF Transcript_2304/g.3937 Transcript_2304/m.3937 type:complete len:349 (-) Transcript_2304:67-1113(-)
MAEAAVEETSEGAPGLGKVAAVVGATGFVGSHLVKCLLERGYAVRGSARDPTGAAWLYEVAGREAGKRLTLQPVHLDVDAAERDTQLDSLLDGADAVFLCAGFERQEPATIDFMVNSALATIQSARRKKVAAVVLTSSGGSTNPPGLTNETPKREHEHWSDPELQKSKGRWSPAAKTLMEINALKAVGRNQQNEIVEAALADDAPRLCIMNPNLILGTQLKPGAITGNSLPWVLGILKGEKMNTEIPNDSMSIIDVRDLAALHVACVERSDASGRYFGVNRSFPWEEILGTFKTVYPAYSIPPRFEGDANTPTQFDCSRRDSLGIPLRGLEDTVKDLVAFFTERGDLS